LYSLFLLSFSMGGASQYSTIKGIQRPSQCLNLPTTCSRGHYARDSNLESGTINGGRSFLAIVTTSPRRGLMSRALRLPQGPQIRGVPVATVSVMPTAPCLLQSHRMGRIIRSTSARSPVEMPNGSLIVPNGSMRPPSICLSCGSIE